MAGVALGNIVLTINDYISHRMSFFGPVLAIAPVSKSHVCVVGIVFHFVFQSGSKISVLQSDASDCVFQSDPATSGTGSMDHSI